MRDLDLLALAVASALRTRGRSALSNPMFDPLDYSGDDDGGHARVCAQCGSTAFRQTDDSMICVECGAEVDRTAFEATDVDLGLAGGVAIGASQRQQRPSGGETAADRRLNIRARDEEAFQALLTVPTDLVFEAFQALVAALARALVDRCGCDARLLPTVEAIWARAVRTTAPQLGDTLARGAALPQLLGEAQVSRMSASAPYAALAPPMALALCLVGCAQARQPVRAADLIAWSRNGRVPLMEAHTTIDATSPAPAPAADAAAGSSSDAPPPPKRPRPGERRFDPVRVAFLQLLQVSDLPAVHKLPRRRQRSTRGSASRCRRRRRRPRWCAVSRATSRCRLGSPTWPPPRWCGGAAARRRRRRRRPRTTAGARRRRRSSSRRSNATDWAAATPRVRVTRAAAAARSSSPAARARALPAWEEVAPRLARRVCEARWLLLPRAEGGWTPRPWTANEALRLDGAAAREYVRFVAEAVFTPLAESSHFQPDVAFFEELAAEALGVGDVLTSEGDRPASSTASSPRWRRRRRCSRPPSCSPRGGGGDLRGGRRGEALGGGADGGGEERVVVGRYGFTSMVHGHVQTWHPWIGAGAVATTGSAELRICVSVSSDGH